MLARLRMSSLDGVEIDAGLFELLDVRKQIGQGQLTLAPVLVGTAVAFISGYLAIAWLLKFLRTRTTMVFVVYRILVGG
jgi:undecaprenyl-diphosphatase